MILPLPPQSGHVCTLRTVPKNDCCVNTTCPLPPHLGHICGVVPGLAPVPLQVGQGSLRLRVISFSTPNTASRNVILTLVRTLAPFMGPFAGPLLPPPKKSPKISPKMSPKSAELKSNPPAPNPPDPSNAANPNWSYCLRLSGSLRTAYASEASLNLASAFLSPGFMSGWYFLASFLYAFFMSSSEASFATPRTS